MKLGVIIHEDHMRCRTRFFDGVLDYCLEQAGLQAFLMPIQAGDIPDPEIIAEVDGLVTWATPGDLWLKELWDAGFPVVNCNNAFLKKIPSVSPGEPDELAYYFLRSLGRKTVGYVTTHDHEAESPLRRLPSQTGSIDDELDWRVFKDVRKDPAAHPEHMLAGRDEDLLEQFLIDLPKPAALWCVHDEMATLVWRKANDLGIHVPADIALLGSGDHPCAMHCTPGITTVRIPEARLGHEAARMIHMHLIGKKRLTKTRVVQPEPGAVVIERASTGGSNPMNRSIYRAWRQIEDYPDDGLTVDHLVQEAKISRISFYKQFEKTFGIPPGKAIRIARTRKAKGYLLSTDMPISEVGRLCGFSGESEFTNFFKRETGQTPKAWRRNAMYRN